MKIVPSLLKVIAIVIGIFWLICAILFFFPDSFIFREAITIIALATSCVAWFCPGFIALIIGEVVRLITIIGFLVVVGLWTVVVLTNKNSKKILSNSKYLFWTGVITIMLIVLPLIWLAFAIPQSANSYRTTPNKGIKSLDGELDYARFQ